MTSFFRKKSFIVSVAGVFIFLALMFFIHATTPKDPPAAVSIHCIGNNANFQCSKNHVEFIARALGPKAAIEDLKHTYAHSAEIVSDCHQLMHGIGNTAAKQNGGNIAVAFLYGDSFCWSGYYHGVVEQAVDDIGEDQFIANANTLCSAIPGKERYSFEYYNCVHGLGHGLMAITLNELFRSLPLCDKLSGEWEKKSCYGGVFMENIMVDNRNHFAKYLKKDDLMYPCDAVDTNYKEQCYLMQTSYALSQTNYDFGNAFKLCANVDSAFRDTCAQSIGRDASGNSVSNVQRTIEHCSRAIDDNQEMDCMIGAVKDFISYFHGGDQAMSLCLAFPEKFKNSCFKTRASYLTTL